MNLSISSSVRRFKVLAALRAAKIFVLIASVVYEAGTDPLVPQKRTSIQPLHERMKFIT
jgi:hypothetical protein